MQRLLSQVRELRQLVEESAAVRQEMAKHVAESRALPAGCDSVAVGMLHVDGMGVPAGGAGAATGVVLCVRAAGPRALFLARADAACGALALTASTSELRTPLQRGPVMASGHFLEGDGGAEAALPLLLSAADGGLVVLEYSPADHDLRVVVPDAALPGGWRLLTAGPPRRDGAGLGGPGRRAALSPGAAGA